MSVVIPSPPVSSAGPDARSEANSIPPQRGWHHVSRAAVRLALLIAGDAAVLLLFVSLLQRVLDELWWWPPAGRALEPMLSRGSLPTVQFLCAVLLALVVLDAYGAGNRRHYARRRFAVAGLGLAFPYWSSLWSDFTPPVMTGFLLLTSVLAVALILERRVLERLVHSIAPIGLGAARALLVASPRDTRRAFKHPALADRREFIICGILDIEVLRRPQGALGVLCREIRRCQADTVVLGYGPLGDEAFGTLQDAAVTTGCELVALTRSTAGAGVEPRMVWSHGAPLVVLTQPAVRTRQFLLKRVVDVIGAVTGLVLLLPFMVVIALAVRLESPGPVIFAHRRVGSGGRPFRCFKFRSMRVDAEELLRRDPKLLAGYLRNNFKVPDRHDPRLTRLGRFLRKTSLDELPQFWNVLRGEMSLVGPRPVVPDELREYGEGAPLLLSVKPGLAGEWAVNGRSEVGYPRRADMEIGYVRNWRFGRDWSILARTVAAVFSQRGAH